MEGTKIKNIVIIVLLLLNGFLLVLVGGRWAQDNQSHGAARESAIQIIRDSGIELDDQVVPRQISLPGLQAQRDLEREHDLAAKLLGGAIAVEARGGDVYRYQSELGWLQIHSTGEFLAEFEPGAFAVGEEDVAQHGVQLLAVLDFEGVVLERNDQSVTLRQTVNSVPVLGCQATLNYRDGSLVSITAGQRVPGRPGFGKEESAVSVATALMRLYNGMNELGDIYNRIDGIESAYTLSVNLSGPAQLTPVWYVKTDTGAYQLDPRTGQVSRMGSAAMLADETAEGSL